MKGNDNDLRMRFFACAAHERWKQGDPCPAPEPWLIKNPSFIQRPDRFVVWLYRENERRKEEIAALRRRAR